jgi:hypothetical protein
MSEDLIKQYTLAAEEAVDEMARLGIKGSTARSKIETKATITFKLPDVLSYRKNAGRIHDKEVELMEKYPYIRFDFDIEFTAKS